MVRDRHRLGVERCALLVGGEAWEVDREETLIAVAEKFAAGGN